MTTTEKIYRLIENGFEHGGMPNIDSYPALKKDKLKSNMGLYVGLQVYFSVIISDLSQLKDMGNELDSMDEKVAYKSIGEFRDLANSKEVNALLKSENTDIQKSVLKKLEQAKDFFYNYRIMKNPHYQKPKDIDNQFPYILDIEHIKFYYNPQEISTKDLLKLNIPTLSNDQDSYVVQRIGSDVSEY